MRLKPISKLLYTVLALLATWCSFSFSDGEVYLRRGTTTCDGVFSPGGPPKRFIPYTYLRQADVAWEKRVWRVIDLREKINQPLMYPLYPTQCRMAFVDMVKIGIMKGEIVAYTDDEFSNDYSKQQAMQKMVVEVTITKTDSLGNPLSTEIVSDTLSNQKITRIRLKEDWFFDKQKSALEVRVLAIGLEWYDEDKELYKPIFWLYYPACREWFSQYELYNPKNDAEKRSYEDFFWKRMFNSYIERESNVFERPINTYARGLDALIEADRIKNDIFKWEHDLWHF